VSGTLVDLFDRSVARDPQATAVHGPDGAATYAEVAALAHAFAEILTAQGVRAGDRVGIWSEKATSTVAAMQGVLRLGAVYVPIDPLGPSSRAATIASDCSMRAIVTTPRRAATLRAGGMPCPLVHVNPASLDETRALCQAQNARGTVLPPAPDDADALAYILYTSGSTGTPKGVCISHRNALAFVAWSADAIAARPADRLANHAPFHFDLSVFDLYVAFHAGASVHLIPEGTSYAAKRLAEFLATRQITILYMVPSALTMMSDDSDFLRRRDLTLRAIVFAGETFPIRPLRALREAFPHAKLWNFYGPTETNVCTAYEVRAIEPGRIVPVPIGQAVCGDSAWALKADGEIAAVGEEGELHVDGPTVMLGYWGREPQGRRPYATGDLVRLLDGGNFEYVGRRDRMVKVRGHRIELGEIEACLQAHAGVKDAVALTLGDGLETRIVCVITCWNASPTLLDLKRQCAERLPRYMIVDDVRVVDAIPRNGNGKLDRPAIQALFTKETEVDSP
jgi:amino acid adenylation domain-containing protein